ncbi:IDEAL domain-containing protein [Litchfieldia alkalitelluris]|uniref:IDEAL domain-containing protein n=1 Tax=Litchfieldia alkalitelluris TaxID=304268 RepID=UPI00195C826A|nr:IDEAL domain-containing protein [Litchfieldia alkalitelluris]
MSYNLTEEQSYTLSLYAQLILDEACYKYNQERLKASIDKAIDNKDQQEFMNKSNEYQNLVSRNT